MLVSIIDFLLGILPFLGFKIVHMKMGELNSGCHTGTTGMAFTSCGKMPNAEGNVRQHLLKIVLQFSNQVQAAHCTTAYALASDQQTKAPACT